jgi:DNA-binding XRE family transcriptional regulator
LPQTKDNNHEDYLAHFGKLVKYYRKAKGQFGEKQDTLAKAVDIDVSKISMIENGTYPSLKYEMVIDICTYLNIPLSELPPY